MNHYSGCKDENLHKMIEDVKLFHQTFGHPIQEKPTIPSPDRQVLRNKLIREEYIEEFDPAWAKCLEVSKALAVPKQYGHEVSPTTQQMNYEALAEFGDVIADLIYYLIGTALEYGIPLAQVWDAVQAANMSKLWTQDEWNDLDAHSHLGWSSHVALPHADLSQGSTRCLTITDETGKVRKPPSWREPNIVEIIKAAS